MLEMRLCQPKVATLAQIEGSHPLRDGSFNACTNGIALFKFLSGLSLPGRLNGLMLSLWMERDLTRVAWCGRTLRPARTGQTLLLAKLDLDTSAPMGIVRPLPFAAGFALRTGHAMKLSVNHKVAHAKALPRTPLPTRIHNDGTQQFDAVLQRTADQMRTIYISRIQRVFRGQQMLVG